MICTSFLFISLFVYEASALVYNFLYISFDQVIVSEVKSIVSIPELSYFQAVGHQKYPSIDLVTPTLMMIVPGSTHKHAQYLTAATYKAIQKNDIDRIILILQSKKMKFHGIALPLKQYDKKLLSGLILGKSHIDILARHSLFHYFDEAYQQSQEIRLQLEYIRHYVSGSIEIIPMIIGHITQDNAVYAAQQIASLSHDKTLIIISDDIQLHEDATAQYHIDTTLEQSLYDADTPIIQALQGIPTGDKNLDDVSVSKKYTYLLALKILEQEKFKNTQSYFVGYDTSISDDNENIAESYAAFIYQYKEQAGYSNYFSMYEQQQLIQVANRSLQSLFEPFFQNKPIMISYEMTQPHGAFVSLYAMSDHGLLLRGCMGSIAPDESLFQLITDKTQDAAQFDSRFFAVAHQEVKSMVVSISLITDIHKIADMNEIKSTDGVWLKCDGRSAISLPLKVALDTFNYKDVIDNLLYELHVPVSSLYELSAEISAFQCVDFQ